MKKTMTALALLLGNIAANAQWTSSDIKDQTGVYGTVSKVYFTSPTKGYVSTTVGEILQSTDGGETWAKVFGPSFYGIKDMGFNLEGDTGYAVSGGTSVLRTVDGGASWTMKNTGLQGQYTKLMDKIFVKDGTHAWVTDSDGSMYKTNNGGDSWTVTTIGSPISMYFKGDTVIQMLGKSSQSISIDGGSTWKPFYTAAPAWSLDKMLFKLGENFVALRQGDGVIARGTSNGADKNGTVTAFGVTNASITNATFFSITQGWASTDKGMYYTTDGGSNWTLSDATLISPVQFFYNFSLGWVGSGYKVYRMGIPTGLNDESHTSEANMVYPNPATTHFSLKQASDEITLSDMNGKMVLKAIGNKDIEVEQLERGIYLLNWNKGTNTGHAKLVLK